MPMSTDEWMRRLERQKSEMLAELSGWPADLREWRPADGGWSALEVLDHLVRTEVGICGVVTRVLAKPRRIGVRDRVGFLFVERVFRSRRRVKVPRSVAQVINPGEGLEFGDISARWDRGRVELRRLVDCAEAANCGGGVFRHPVSGWMSFEQVLRFFSVHMVHHGFQLERIREALRATSRWR